MSYETKMDTAKEFARFLVIVEQAAASDFKSLAANQVVKNSLIYYKHIAAEVSDE